MKRLLPTLLLLIGVTPFLNAQWSTPGNGDTYTMSDLVGISDGIITQAGTTFVIHEDIIISRGDVLYINDEVARIEAPDVLIQIQGSVTCSNSARVMLTGTMTQQFRMRLDNATGCEFRKMYFSDGSGINIVESEVLFDDVKFLYFTTDYCSAVLDIFNCDPVINNCIFMTNDGAAIASAANGQSSPQITNCQIEANVRNLNSPQINLGPGGNDTIRIVNNLIDDAYVTWYVGGISISDLLDIGSTKALIKNNTVKNGRYGYNQQGIRISSVIEGNQFIDNNHEDNPMNGGSGISIYGYSTECKAILRNNLITGNLWGITAIYYHDIDLGTEDDWGHNEIHDNGNGGVVYDLYNNSTTCDISAVGNNWGTTIDQEVEDHIFHQADDPTLGLVTYTPFVGYDQLEELPLESPDIDLTHAIIFNLTGQRVRPESLKAGIYVVQTEQGPQKIIIP